MDLQPLQLITLGGAAGAFFLIIKYLIDGKLHTASEVAGLKDDKQTLLKINHEQAEALRASNAIHETSRQRIVQLESEVKRLEGELDRNRKVRWDRGIARLDPDV